jgi:sugar transferase EpsL
MQARCPPTKRAFDLACAAVALLLSTPILATIAVLVRFRLGAPVLFAQERIGLNEIPFRIYKFRTMTNARNSQGHLLPDANRLTPFGKFLRSTSLDELPQLWCVLTGSLSLVGPRPLLPQYLPRYTAEQRLRHTVMPGITGWAQINGRNASTWEQRFQNDIWYVRNWSFWLDIKIIALTVLTVLRRSGISNPASATMTEFMGSNIPKGENIE